MVRILRSASRLTNSQRQDGVLGPVSPEVKTGNGDGAAEVAYLVDGGRGLLWKAPEDECGGPNFSDPAHLSTLACWCGHTARLAILVWPGCLCWYMPSTAGRHLPGMCASTRCHVGIDGGTQQSKSRNNSN